MTITLDDIKKMSPQLKALIICLVYIILGYFYYFYFIRADMDKRSDLQTKLKELELQVAEKERLAAEIAKYSKGLDALKKSFETALTKLPIRKEIPELLHSVAVSGKNAGLVFIIFEPQPTVKKSIGARKDATDQKPPDQKPPEQKPPEQKPADKKPADGKSQSAKPLEEEEYYEEIPVKVTVNGSYHNTAVFFEKVARLPRIINIEDIAMAEAKLKVKGMGQLLNTSCIVKTYMFVQKKTAEKGKKADEKNK
ncbi:MAG TPA: type 4a pilus biogenesis protein PilO [Syntrophales bacterium]|nr:type 4a pilus biogenesis protein PilO [Syntrophales bacterium]